MSTSLEKAVDSKYIKMARTTVQLKKYIGGLSGKSLPLLANKIFAFVIGSIDQESSEIKETTFDISDFWNFCGIEPSTKKYYTLVAEALQLISDRSGWVMRVNENGKTEIVLVRLLDKPKFEKDSKIVSVRIDPDMAPALLQLRSNYTQYSLQTLMKLESKYGFDLYELLCTYETQAHDGTTVILLSVQELAENLDATSGSYANKFSNFKKKVLDAAVQDINEHQSEIFVSYETKKTGRAITHIEFTIRRMSGTCSTVEDAATGQKQAELDPTLMLRQQIRKQIEYDTIVADCQSGRYSYDLHTLTLILEIMLEAMTSQQASYNINGGRIPREQVAQRFGELSQTHICFVLDKINDIPKEIKNPRAYMRSMLYNAPTTMDLYYTSKVNADMSKKPTGGEVKASGKLGKEEIEAIRWQLSQPDDFLGG